MIDLAKLIAHSGATLDRNHDYGFHLDLTNKKLYSAKLIVITNYRKSTKKHYHKIKQETFICLSGVAIIDLERQIKQLSPGDSFTLESGQFHRIYSPSGDAVILEVATHDDDKDTYYE